MKSRRLARRGSTIVALVVSLVCALHPAAVRAADATPGAAAPTVDEPTFGPSVLNGANAAFDVLFLRTTGLAVLLVGVGLFVPAAIVSSPGGKTPILEAWDRLVVQPAGYTVTRPIGEF
jgi:hypothetical protein